MDLKEYRTLGQNTVRHPWEQARVRIIGNLIKKFYGYGTAKLLDIGCGDCYLIKTLLSQFKTAQAVAVDKNIKPHEAEQICTNLPPNISLSVVSGLEQNPQAAKEADIVLMLDVLEHIQDDNAALKDFTANSPAALYIITVPAFNCLYTQHDKALGHYRRYNLAALKTLAQNTNLKILDCGYFFNGIIIIRALSKFLEYFKQPTDAQSANALKWPYGKPAATLVSALLYAEFKLSTLLKFFGINTAGLSAYIICRKG